MQLVISTFVQKALQVVADPLRESVVQLLESPHALGQFPSQTSFVSIMLLPQLGLQSESLLLLHPLGQHPSTFAQTVISVKTQAALQLAELPLRESEVQTRPSSQVVGQFPSQVSPASTILLAQIGAQSPSFRLLQPGAQQVSPEVQLTISGYEQVALQVVEEPDIILVVHAFWSSQLVGQSPSQSSPASSRPFPQPGRQSSSEREVQPAGQQASLSRQLTTGLFEH